MSRLLFHFTRGYCVQNLCMEAATRGVLHLCQSLFFNKVAGLGTGVFV